MYEKTEWKDQVVETPRTYTMRDNGDGTVTLIDSFGQITELGTPVNAQNMNKIEKGIFEAQYPVGAYMPMSTDDPEDGWLVCDGSAVSREDYSELFAKIGTKYGEGDSLTTFNLPNFINRTFWGGTSSGTYLEAGLPNITGATGSGGYQGVYGGLSGSGAIYNKGINASGVGLTLPASSILVELGFDASRSSVIYGKSTTVQPAALQTLIMIKY